jgi:hypothetical protein
MIDDLSGPGAKLKKYLNRVNTLSTRRHFSFAPKIAGANVQNETVCCNAVVAR